MSTWNDYFPEAEELIETPNIAIAIDDFFSFVIKTVNNASDDARRGATMSVGVVTPLRRNLGGAAGIVTPALLDQYAQFRQLQPGDSNAVLGDIASSLERGFRATPPLDEKLKMLIDSLLELDNRERVMDQLRDASDTFLVISKVPTKELRDRFVNRMGWTENDAEKVSFAIYKKKRPQLPVVVVTKGKMEVAASAVDDQDVEIDISGCGLEMEDVETFATKLESGPLAVTSLDASANTFHRRGADAICRMSTAAKNLKELSVAGNNIQAPGIVAVVETVAQNNNKLTRLDLSNNFLTTEGAQKAGLVDAVAKTNPHLQWLGLAGNELCQAAGGEICAGLIRLGKLRTLVLNCNKLGSGGIAQMAPAIEKDRALQHLYLDANDMRDDDIIALAKSLTFHPTITSIHLKQNPLIGVDGFKALSKLVKLNPGLIQLTYDEESTYSQQVDLVSAIEFNKKRLVNIHHRMVRDAGQDVSNDGLALWLRMTVGNADLVDFFKSDACSKDVDGESVWSVSGAKLEGCSKQVGEYVIQEEFFPMLEMLCVGRQ